MKNCVRWALKTISLMSLWILFFAAVILPYVWMCVRLHLEKKNMKKENSMVFFLHTWNAGLTSNNHFTRFYELFIFLVVVYVYLKKKKNKNEKLFTFACIYNQQMLKLNIFLSNTHICDFSADFCWFQEYFIQRRISIGLRYDGRYCKKTETFEIQLSWFICYENECWNICRGNSSKCFDF